MSEAVGISSGPTRSRTLGDKIWDAHVVSADSRQPDLLYVDLHLTHEATSAPAFAGLREAGRPVRRPDLTLALEDHNVPTLGLEILEPSSRQQLQALRANCRDFGVPLFSLGHRDQGIVHVVAPELGLVQPGMTVACGDSHTSTLGALGALAFGIGSSEVEQVLATQLLPLRRFPSMRVSVDGVLPAGVSAKDIALHVISAIGANGAGGHIVEYAGSVVREMSIEARMTLCNMTAECGGRTGIIGVDETTIDYLRGRRWAPSGPDASAAEHWWRQLRSDDGARFDREVCLDVSTMSPYVTWGTNPAHSIPIDSVVPDPEQLADHAARDAARAAQEYMALRPGQPLRGMPVDVVFIGSCTNARIEDLRAAAAVIGDRSVASGTRLLIVPGSAAVRRQAEEEGLDRIFRSAGGEWRNAGCSICLGMNDDRLAPGLRCASTSNRNFRNRQGPGVRTHLMSPAVAAATAVLGAIGAPGDLEGR